MNEAHRKFRFGPFELDSARYELRRKGHKVPISGASMDLLLLMVSSGGELVTRKQIVAVLWQQPQSVDVTQGVNTAMTRLRAILSDDASSPRYLQTVVGKGYRFIAPVEEVQTEAAFESPGPAPESPASESITSAATIPDASPTPPPIELTPQPAPEQPQPNPPPLERLPASAVLASPGHFWLKPAFLVAAVALP